MRKYGIWLTILLLILGWTALPALSVEQNPASDNDVKVAVTVLRHGKPAPVELKADDVFVYQNNKRRPVVRWVKAQGENAGLDVAILVDDSLSSSIGNHFPDLKSFIKSLPADTKVAIVYGSHGNAEFAQNFTADHAKAAASIRIPTGPFSEGSSIYMALNDLIKHWPDDGNRRAVLMLSDGIDLYWGVTESLPSTNPDLQKSVRDSQRYGVSVYSIYANTTGGAGGSPFLVNAGQSCLSFLSLASGGRFFYQGTQTPINFQPILQEMKDRLDNQYLLTFRAEPGKKAGYDRLRITTEQSGIRFVAPMRVYVPGVGK